MALYHKVLTRPTAENTATAFPQACCRSKDRNRISRKDFDTSRHKLPLGCRGTFIACGKEKSLKRFGVQVSEPETAMFIYFQPKASKSYSSPSEMLCPLLVFQDLLRRDRFGAAKDGIQQLSAVVVHHLHHQLTSPGDSLGMAEPPSAGTSKKKT